MQLAGENYLLPIDIEGQNADQIRDDAVALQLALDDLREQKTRFALAIIDACRDTRSRAQEKRSADGDWHRPALPPGKW